MAAKLLTIGIDIGNTNSTACFHDGVSPRVIENPQGERVTPSVIAETETGELIGRPAQSQARSNPHTFQRWKRYLGADFTPDEATELPLVEGDDGKAWIVGRNNEPFPPERLTASMIEFYLDAAEQRLGKRPNGLVITVPAGYPDAAKRAVIRAANSVGIDRVRLIPEPVAAAVSYGIDKKKMELVCVFDIGGSTSDISLMRVGAKNGNLLHSTLVSLSDNRLGGMNFDQRIMERAVAEFETTEKIDLRSTPRAMARIHDACEIAKKQLSSTETARVDVSMVTHTESGMISMNHEISRTELETMTADLVERSLDLCRDALSVAKITVDEIDKVILVGGQTMMPAIENAVESFFGRKPLATVSPFEVVAIGASIIAAQEDGRLSAFSLNDRTSLSVGIRSHTDAFLPLIPRNTAYPARHEFMVKTMQDGQEQIALEVRQGNHVDALENDILHEVQIPVTPQPAGEAKASVTLEIDRDGLVSVAVGG